MSNEDIYSAALDYATVKLRLEKAEMEYGLAITKREEAWKEVRAAGKLLGGFVGKKCRSRLIRMEDGSSIMIRWNEMGEEASVEMYDSEGRLV